MNPPAPLSDEKSHRSRFGSPNYVVTRKKKIVTKKTLTMTYLINREINKLDYALQIDFKIKKFLWFSWPNDGPLGKTISQFKPKNSGNGPVHKFQTLRHHHRHNYILEVTFSVVSLESWLEWKWSLLKFSIISDKQFEHILSSTEKTGR